MMRTDRPEDDKGPTRSSAGRPRDGKIDAAIITATRDLLLETGYSALSLSAIAARAGTTTAAIYRRWSGKAQLVHEAILPAEVMAMPSASGDMAPSAREGDIRALVEATRTMFDRQEVRIALPGLIADTVADPDVHRRMTARFAEGLATFRTRIDEPGSPDDDGTLPLLAEVVVGSAILRIIVRQDAPLDAAWVDELTALIISGWTSTSHGSTQ